MKIDKEQAVRIATEYMASVGPEVTCDFASFRAPTNTSVRADRETWVVYFVHALYKIEGHWIVHVDAASGEVHDHYGL
jgi:hypothetical protein